MTAPRLFILLCLLGALSIFAYIAHVGARDEASDAGVFLPLPEKECWPDRPVEECARALERQR